MMIQNSRRTSSSNNQTDDNPLTSFFKKPYALPLLLTLFLLLTWLSLKLQHTSHFSSPTHFHKTKKTWSQKDDEKANLIRFTSGSPQVFKDKRGWLLNPVSIALQSPLKGGAVSCVSTHVGQIRPGGIRGNHRHYVCNETFVIWGAKTKFRLENNEVGKGYAEVIIDEDEIVVAASPKGTAHALVNVDPVRIAYFMGCQDAVINYNSSRVDFNVWNNL